MCLGCSPSVKIGEFFYYCILVHRLRKLKTLEFIVFEWFERMEPNNTTLYDPRIRSKPVHPWVSAKIFSGGATSKFRLFFSGCWRCSVKGLLQTLCPFYPITLVCVGWTSILYLLSVDCNVFSTSAIRNAFSFHNVPNIHFLERFLLISHSSAKEHTRWKIKKARHSRKTVSSNEQ